MFRAKCHLKGMSPLSFGRRYEDKPPKDVDPWEHEVKTWRGRLHIDSNGECIIPGPMILGSLVTAVNLQSEKIPGTSGAKYWTRFQAGVIVENDIPLGIKKNKVEYEDVYVKQQRAQVRKRFPIIRKWEGWVTFTVIPDEIITREIFERYLKRAGQIAGIGRYRPPKKGTYGRFSVEKIEYEKIKS